MSSLSLVVNVDVQMEESRSRYTPLPVTDAGFNFEWVVELMTVPYST